MAQKINYRLRVEAFNCMSDAELYDQEIYDLVMSLTVTEIPDEPPVLSAEKLNIQAALGLMAAGRPSRTSTARCAWDCSRPYALGRW